MSGLECTPALLATLTCTRIRQYELRISKWGVEKKVKTSEMVFISKRQRLRRTEEPEKNRLRFELRGTPVPDDKIVRFEKRNPDIVQDGTIVSKCSGPPSPAAMTSC